MQPKPIVVSFFTLLAFFFYGIAAISGGETTNLIGYSIIGTIHLAFALGLWRGLEIFVNLSAYLALLDMLFGLLWIMVGLSFPAATLTLLSALALFILMDEDVRSELKMP
ncbi:hypothetical protein CL1_1461 [Thermococcus cleftensis]|uniref:Uncharacterized protein n=1 Tax=Thermococcus cleftensis (strain DSM 27260 / KACC 17922 / CL1) TaxID=163003 RepID=I3ZVC6_THECF|nr:hypothetical protein [Thermococcus cleftensis]AFL95660.1 hypothetical protein CL1_1461 [Thermococcus cleftensis]